MSATSSPPRMPAPLGWAAVVLSWLIPGSGFMLCGRWARGLIHFLLVGVTFALGLALHSSVAWPTWSMRSEEFNLINNFTFVIQMGSGVLAFASFYASSGSGVAGGALAWLAGAAPHPSYELGSYFLIVAGALNYFAAGNFYDRIVAPESRFEAQESSKEAQAA